MHAHHTMTIGLPDARSLPVRRLVRRDVAVTTLGFGAASIGNLYRAIDDESAAAAVEAAWQGGIRYFDTAPHYGLGLSERRLGAALADRPRDEYVLSTKVGRLLAPNEHPTGSDLAAGGFAVPDDSIRVYDYSRDGVRRSIDASLERLGVDRIDIAYLHDPENHMDQAISEGVPALAELREEGVIRAIGAGMNFTEPLQRIAREADVDVLMVAGRYTLLDRTGAELLDECGRRSISVVDAAPFNSGLLAKPWPDDDAQFDYAGAPPRLVARARELAATCREHGVELPAAALQFPLRHPAVVSVVSGMRTAEQVMQAVDRMRQAAADDLWDALS